MVSHFFVSLRGMRTMRSFMPGTIWSSPWTSTVGIRHRYVIARVA
jgi:hypothetical protein